MDLFDTGWAPLCSAPDINGLGCDALVLTWIMLHMMHKALMLCEQDTSWIAHHTGSGGFLLFKELTDVCCAQMNSRSS